jgi:hypothetical protein
MDELGTVSGGGDDFTMAAALQLDAAVKESAAPSKPVRQTSGAAVAKIVHQTSIADAVLR